MLHLSVLLIAIFFMTLWALIIHKGEIFAPSVGMCMGFFISVIAAMMNAVHLRLNDIRWSTVATITGGLFIFIFVDFIVHMTAQSVAEKKLGHPWRGFEKENGEIFVRNIDCGNVMIVLLILFIMISAFLYTRSVFAIVRDSGRHAETWREVMSQFRSLVSYREGDERVPFLIEQIHQMITLLGYVVTYLLIYQYVFFNRKHMGLFFLLIAIVINSFLSSSRTEMLRYIVAAIVIYDFFRYWKEGSGVKCKVSLMIKLMIGGIALSFLFSALRSFAGRMSSVDPVSYIALYLGQSIHNLNIFLQDTPEKSRIWGKETFSGLSRVIYYLTGNAEYSYIGHKEFRFFHGISLGNVYTIFRAFIHDFGYTGMVVLTALCSFTCNLLYEYIRSSVWRRHRADYYIPILYYSLFVFAVYFAFFTDYYFYLIGFALISKDILAFWGFELILARLKWSGSERGYYREAVAVNYRPGI